MHNGKRLLIIGAGGHGCVAADIARLMGFEVAFLDDKADLNMPIVGPVKDYNKYLLNASFFVAIGNNALRKRLLNELNAANAHVVTLIHPKAVIAADSIIELGSIVMAGAVINSGAKIGKGVIINTCSSVDHDCVIGDYTHIAVGSHVAGTVMIGEEVFVGAGAIVVNNVCVCNNCIIGAGGVVVNNITEPGTYVGVPVKKIH